MRRPLRESKGPLRKIVGRRQVKIGETNGMDVFVDYDDLECGHRERSDFESSPIHKRRCRGCRDGDNTPKGGRRG